MSFGKHLVVEVYARVKLTADCGVYVGVWQVVVKHVLAALGHRVADDNYALL